MSSPISVQANKVLKTLSDPATASAYQQAGAVTWTLIKETGILLWLVLCLALVAFDWFYNTAVSSGRNFRGWFDNLDQPDTNRIASEAGRALLSAGKNSLNYTIAKARVQVGLPEKPSTPDTATGSGVEPSPATAPPAAPRPVSSAGSSSVAPAATSTPSEGTSAADDPLG